MSFRYEHWLPLLHLLVGCHATNITTAPPDPVPSTRSADQSQGQPTIPDTPATRQFSAWLAAFNLGDPVAYRRFLERNFPARASHFEQEMDFRRPPMDPTGHQKDQKLEMGGPPRRSHGRAR